MFANLHGSQLTPNSPHLNLPVQLRGRGDCAGCSSFPLPIANPRHLLAGLAIGGGKLLHPSGGLWCSARLWRVAQVADTAQYEIEMTLWRVLLWAWIASMVCVVMGVPLAQATGWEDSGVGAILGRIIGHGSLNAAMLSVVYAPVFSKLRRLRAINPAVGTLIGVLIPLAALLLISNPTATTWGEKLSETIET